MIFYTQDADEDLHSHWIQVGLILEMIVPSETEAHLAESKAAATNLRQTAYMTDP